MSTIKKTTALMAGLAMTLSTQSASAQHVEVIGQQGIEPGSGYVIYLGDEFGAPDEVIHAGDIPYVAERRLLIPLPEVEQGRRYWIATEDGGLYAVPSRPVSATFGGAESSAMGNGQQGLGMENPCRTTDPGGCPNSLGNAGAWNGQPMRGPQAGLSGAASGAQFGDQQGVENDETASGIEGKAQHEVGRLRRTMVSDASNGAGASLGAADAALAGGQQLGELDMYSGEGQIIESQAEGSGQAIPSGQQGFLGGSGQVGNGLQGHGMSGDTGAGGQTDQGDEARHHKKETVAGRTAGELVDMGEAADAGAALGGGSVTVVLGGQSIGFLMDF